MAETDAQLPELKPEAPVERPRRAHSILGRLTQAVREQNWFAVVLEVAIVVLGVVIGFQVNAWGQARADRQREAVYVRSLERDLRLTLDLLDEADSVSQRRSARPLGAFVASFGREERPPRDSVLTWAWGLYGAEGVRPILGAARSLIERGDLTLIRDDSLASQIVAYVAEMEEMSASQDNAYDQVKEARRWVEAAVDIPEYLRSLPSAERDRFRANMTFVPEIIPGDEWSAPFPLDVDDVYESRSVYRGVTTVTLELSNMTNERSSMRDRTRSLLDLVQEVRLR